MKLFVIFFLIASFSLVSVRSSISICKDETLDLSAGVSDGAGAGVGDYVMFAGGYSTAYSQQADLIHTPTMVKTSYPFGLSVGRNDFAGAGVGKYIVFGGGNSASGKQTRVDVFNLSTKSWVNTNFPSGIARSTHAAAAAGNLILFGGGAQPTATEVVDIFDATTGSFKINTTLSQARYGLAAASAKNFIFFAGGNIGVSRVTTVDIFDTNTSTWLSPSALTVARDSLAGAGAGDLVLFGGGSTGSGDSARIDIFNVTTWSWSVVDASNPFAQAGAAGFGRYVGFFGGFSGGYLDEVRMYDLNDNTVSYYSLTTARTKPASAASETGTMICAGGQASGVKSDEVSGFIPANPEVMVVKDSTEIVDGVTNIDFGSVAINTNVEIVLNVSNTAFCGVLDLSNLVVTGTGFSEEVGFGTANLNPLQWTTFTIRMNSSTAASLAGSVTFNNNDDDENPFSFTVSGTVLDVEIEVVDKLTLDVLVDGSSSVDFGQVLPSAIVQRTFLVKNVGGGINLTLSNLAITGAGFNVSEGFGASIVSPGENTTFIVQMSSPSTGLLSETVSFDNNDQSESPFSFVVTGEITAPEISVSVAGNDIPNGASYDFGKVAKREAKQVTFNIENSGEGTLTLDNLNATGEGFTISSTFGKWFLEKDESTTFVLEAFEETKLGTYNGQVQFTNNDPDEGTYVIDATVEIVEESGASLVAPFPWVLSVVFVVVVVVFHM